MSEKIRIAIADDHIRVRKAVKVLLQAFGFDVILEANDGMELIYQIEGSPSLPDVCILDVNMPKLDGCETAKVIKSKWGSIKIIGFSVDEKNKVKMLKNGADCFLLKDSEKLYQTIIDLTGNRI
jgi:two-component system, NarL family, invasion response regulator UvrY